MYELQKLAAYRQLSDDAGDQLIRDLYANLSKKEIGQLFQHYMNSLDEVDVDTMPDVLKVYFQNFLHLPGWADQRQITLAEDVFLRYGPEYSMALLARGLAVGYVTNVSKVLTSTGYLASDVKVGTAKRLLETAQFVFDVMDRDALKPGGRGLKSILKVRFIHSMVRYHLAKQGWDDERYGIPINQEDMSGTILTFGVAALLGLERLGVALNRDEQDAIVHFWAIVGHVIGVDEALNPRTYREGKELYLTILDSQAQDAEDGRILARALANFIKEAVGMDLLPSFQDQLMRFLIDNDRYSDLLGIRAPENRVEQMAFDAAVDSLRLMNKFRDNSLVNEAAKPLNRFIIMKTLAYFDSEFQMKLHIPEGIRASWGILESDDLAALKEFPMLRSVVAQGRDVLSFS